MALLEHVIAHRVRDERSRTELWRRARQLHAAACAAETGKILPTADRVRTPGTRELLRETQHANAELARSEEAVRTLLGLTAKLQKELDAALKERDRTAGRTRREASREVLSAAEAARADHSSAHPRPTPTATAHDENPAGSSPAGKALVLWRPPQNIPHPGDEMVSAAGTEVEIRRLPLTVPQHTAARELRLAGARPTGVSAVVRVRRDLVRLGTTGHGDRGPRRPQRLVHALLLAAFILVCGVTAISVEPARQPPPRPTAASPSTDVPGTIVREYLPDTSAGPLPSASPRPSRPRGPVAGPAQPALPAPAVPSLRAPAAEPPRRVEVAAPEGSGVYAIAADGKAVVQWSGTGSQWSAIGGPAQDLYAGPAGVFATDPETGELQGYSGQPGRWQVVSDRAAGFAISGTNLYRLANDHSGVHRWDKQRGTWRQIGGPAGHIYGGGAGLFATDPVDGRIFAYSGSGSTWSYAGTAGAEFAVTNQHLYGLNPERSAVFRWTGEAGKWNQVGGAATTIYASSTELFATNGMDSGMWRYREGTWARIGDAGAGFGGRAERVYRLDNDQRAIWEWDGAAWKRIGGPARTLAVAS
ncbi:hypothetical protein [Streptomyces sp. NPDC056670]|uniref:hypothetical protein n=1 Tax=Streptomyces sp. NPDC056670 TaxID=3345904 RepID=UPI0036A0B663